MDKIKKYKYKAHILYPKRVGVKNIFFFNDKHELRKLEKLYKQYPVVRIEITNFDAERIDYSDEEVSETATLPWNRKGMGGVDRYLNFLSYE